MHQYVELICRTNYSFLHAGSWPGELITQARDLGYHGIAITDRNGVYGMPKAWLAAREFPELKFIVGAEVLMERGPSLVLLARNRRAYGVLCRILTKLHAGKEKGEGFLRWEELSSFRDHLGFRQLVALPLLPETVEASPPQTIQHANDLSFLKDLFDDRLYIPLARFLDGKDEQRTNFALQFQKQFNVEIVATNHVHFHIPERRVLQDVVVSIRETTPLQEMGTKLFSNAERYLKTPEQMHFLFSDIPEAIANTLKIADSCSFKPSELRYRYPSEWIPKGETAQSYLCYLVKQGIKERYPEGVPAAVVRQLEHELKLIDQLEFADYFLTIWEIVEFARQKDILCQGRGSAANSAVCYCLGITAIDPVRMNLLFERFISAERGEPPDIDVDFEHERREEVIQHIYEKYGRDRAAMVAAVVKYRSKSAIREVKKSFGIDPDDKELGKLADDERKAARAAELAITKELVLAERVAEEIRSFPRHLSIHSGGFTLSADPIIEIVPVEPARMEGRTIIQWDKDDLDALGLLKIDVLALGMLTAIQRTLKLIGKTLVEIPAEDRDTYAMIQKADTIGVFQIESRAQMSMLPRLKPACFYDLVIEVAIMRPGPIVGKMVHPYLRRRRGWEKPFMPHPKLEPILRKTLGVPIFQEQVMKMAIVLAGFSPGEADELRRAIGAWRSSGAINKIGERLREGLLRSGLPQKFVDQIFDQIQGFSEYGFPESHAASFALLAYASSYLKCHHPLEFTCALLNSQPMGFYSPHTLVNDAKRHGVSVLPIHPEKSDWDHKIETGKLRLGFRITRGMTEAEGKRIIEEREKAPFQSLQDFLERTRLRRNVLFSFALGDAFAIFKIDQRHALWEILAWGLYMGSSSQEQLELFADENYLREEKQKLFPGLSKLAAIRSEHHTYGLSLKGHPMQELRKLIPRISKRTVAATKKERNGVVVQISGLIVVRQRPPTAKGTSFATLEDETGFLDMILHPKVYDRYEKVFRSHCFLSAQGKVQRDGLLVQLIVEHLSPLNLQKLDEQFHKLGRAYYL